MCSSCRMEMLSAGECPRPADGLVARRCRGLVSAMAAGHLPFVVTEGGSGPARLRLVCGFLGCDALPFNPVLSALPPLMKVRVAGDSEGRLKALLEFAVTESNGARAGSRSVLLRIAELVFVEVLRSYLTAASSHGIGWLGGLRDPIVGARWHACTRSPPVPGRCPSSRTRPAPRAPCWRNASPASWDLHRALPDAMADAACRQPSRSRDGAGGAVAGEVGYESEAAFCRAFKKVTGVTPASSRSRRRVEST